ncbi:MAG TPA: AMP-binding protein, partial [Jatrophihabitantaceae bacterium]
ALGGIPVLSMASRDWVDEHPDTDLGHAADPGAVLLQIYTSGTTGVPKGVQLTLSNLAYTEEGVAAEGLAADSVVLNALPTFHIAGQGWAISALIAGAHTIMVPEFVPGELVELMESERVTNAFMVPAMLRVLTSLPGIDERDFSALRMICYGASPITPAVLRRSMQVFGCQFAQLYGMTETSGVTTMLRPEDHDPDGPREGLLRSAGLPQPFTEVRVVDVDSGEVLPADEVGEIQTRSPYATVGYWNRPADTAALYTADGWLRSGDAGYLDADGYLFISDRIKDMVITGGENVYPVEVEAVLADHPAVAEVAVIGTPDAKWGEAVTAVVVLRPGAAATEAELVAFTSGRLASYKKPRIVRFVDVLPRNPSGKVLKRELRDVS